MRRKRWRPTSLFLLMAIPVVMLLGLQLVVALGEPRRFALVLALLFAFFGLTLLHGLLDLFDILRRRLREDRDAYRDTLGDPGFARELGERVNARKRA